MQVREVKADIANSTKEQENLREDMNKQFKTIQFDLTSHDQSKVVMELRSEVISLATALREQTELVVEQRRQMKESL